MSAMDDVQGTPRPALDRDEIFEPGAPTPPAFPASDVAATAAAEATASAETAPAPVPQARSAASAPEPPNAGVEGCPQDPKASGLDALVGAVDIVGAADMEVRGNRAGLAAIGNEASGQRAATPAGGNSDQRTPSEEASGSERADWKGGGNSNGNEEEGTAYRAQPRAFADHAPSTGTEGAGAATGTLPGFSAIKHSVEAEDAAFSAPGTTANSWRERLVNNGSIVTLPPPPAPLGPTARDTYATLTGAALPAAPAFPGLAPKKVVSYDDEGFRLSPIPPEPASPAKSNPAKRKAAKMAKALKTKATTKTKIQTKRKLKPAKKKKKTASLTTAKKAKSSTRRTRRGPAGQSHFKGVCLTPSGTWRAVIYVDRRQKYLGVFDNEFDAARAYDAAAILHFPDATPPLNNPDDVERQLNAISATDGKPIATAGAPQFKPTPSRLEEGCGPRARA